MKNNKWKIRSVFLGSLLILMSGMPTVFAGTADMAKELPGKLVAFKSVAATQIVKDSVTRGKLEFAESADKIPANVALAGKSDQQKYYESLIIVAVAMGNYLNGIKYGHLPLEAREVVAKSLNDLSQYFNTALLDKAKEVKEGLYTKEGLYDLQK